MTEGSVVFRPPPQMRRMMRSNAFVRVAHGPVGSGKSSTCVMELPRRARMQAAWNGTRSTRFAVVRNTYRELQDTTRRTFEQWCGGLGEWRESDFAFHIRIEDPTTSEVVESEILFRALDRPQDVKKLLSLELTGAYVNELREVPKVILDGLSMRVGRYPAKKDGGATWSGVWADTNPWAEGSDYAELFQNPPEGFELYRQPSGLSPEAENSENLPDGYYQRMCAGKDAEWINEYVHGRNPKSDQGSVYGQWLADLDRRQRIGEFDHPKDGVFATFDLGISDATAIWFWRLNRHGVPDLIDWHEATGEGFEHFASLLKSKGYSYSKIWLPHDARARTFQTGISTFELFRKAFPDKVGIVPEMGVEDGIGATRWMLEQPIRIHERCAEGLKRVRAYRFEWDEARKVFSKKPLHDWTSHTADALRYVAAVVKHANSAATREEKKKPALPVRVPLTLDELEEAHPTERRRL